MASPQQGRRHLLGEYVMLIEFSVKNFRSIKEEQTLSMVASADKELEGNVFPLTRDGSAAKRWKDTRLLKSAVIYGANASGKSNLLKALQYFSYQIGKIGTLSINPPFDAVSFKLDAEWEAAPSEFRITFTVDDDGVVYEYFVKIQFEKGVVLEEKLDFYPNGRQKCLFHRTSSTDSSTKITFPGNNIKGVRGLSEQTARDALFVSVASAFNQPLLVKIRSWFSVSEAVRESSSSSYHLYNHVQYATLFERDDAFKKQMASWLCAADLGITDLGSKDKEISYTHKVNDEGRHEERTGIIKELVFLHEGVTEEFIEYKQESSGTKRWANLFLETHRTIANGSFVLIDEISADLHPLLSAYFMALFHDPRFNPKNAQLICTTHHSSLLSSDLLRRDQIWFAEKDGEGASHYYSLLDYYSPRKDKAIMKGYLAGEFGAVPDLAAMDSLLEKMGL